MEEKEGIHIEGLSGPTHQCRNGHRVDGLHIVGFTLYGAEGKDVWHKQYCCICYLHMLAEMLDKYGASLTPIGAVEVK